MRDEREAFVPLPAGRRIPIMIPVIPVMAPIPMMLYCPRCKWQHVDAPEPPDWDNPPHKSHLCKACGTVWRPADVHTVGVKSIASRGLADTYP